MVWQDEQVSADANIRAARINSDGSIAAGWSLNGNIVCDASSDQTRAVLTTDQENGAIIAWADGRNWDIYVLRMQSDGTADPNWTANGVPLTLVTGSQTSPEITSDGFGGALVVWMDTRTSGNGQDIYAQRITGTGAVVWAANGVALSTAALDQAYPRIVPNGTGGAIVVWDDKRNVSSTIDDIYAQAINAAGAVQWPADGAAITTDSSSQTTPVIAPDGYGGAVIAWRDFQNDPTYGDIWATRVGSDGAVGVLLAPTPGVSTSATLAVCPNPTRMPATVTLVLGRSSHAELYVFDISGRAIRRLIPMTAEGSASLKSTWDLRDETGRRVSPGMYWVRARTESEELRRAVHVLQ